jgi:hypothetical protein
MNAYTRIAAATLLAFGFASAASAEEWTGPRVVGTGENNSLVYPTPSQNIVGGAIVRSTGSGESAGYEVLSVENSFAGRPSRQVGSGESSQSVLPGQRG